MQWFPFHKRRFNSIQSIWMVCVIMESKQYCLHSLIRWWFELSACHWLVIGNSMQLVCPYGCIPLMILKLIILLPWDILLLAGDKQVIDQIYDIIIICSSSSSSSSSSISSSSIDLSSNDNNDKYHNHYYYIIIKYSWEKINEIIWYSKYEFISRLYYFRRVSWHVI